jgi:hypothetical protein
MSAKNTWLWILIAAGLFALILLLPRPKPVTGPIRILPSLKAETVTAIRILPKGGAEIRADRTNGAWQLTRPISYPANAAAIEDLLARFQRLTPAMHIAEGELTNRFNADEEFGFADPRLTLIFEQGGSIIRLRLGKATLPGDQEYLQVVGIEGIYVVETAEVSKRIPESADDWRDPALVHLRELSFDHLAVTNGPKFFVLRRDATNHLWRMASPIDARADNAKIDQCLEQLQQTRITRFVSDQPRADLDTFGLQPPLLDLALASGTNTVALLQFGKSPTNDTRQLYAQRVGRNTLFTVPLEPLAPWRTFETYNDFREPRLIELPASVKIIEARGASDPFTLERQPDGAWRLAAASFPTDPDFIKQFVSAFTNLAIAEFTKDVVPKDVVVLEQTLTNYGLLAPSLQYLLKSSAADSPSNALAVSFGANKEKFYARRSDEPPVYEISAADFRRLPAASWQFRDRHLWDFTTNDVATLASRQDGRVLRIQRRGPFQWSVAPGSQGSINDLAVEDTVRELIQGPVLAWVARGDQALSRLGFASTGRQITLELNTGNQVTVQFGGQAPSGDQYAAVTLEGQPWVFEMAASLYRDIQTYLSVPTGP